MGYYQPVDPDDKKTGRPLKWTEEAAMQLIDEFHVWIDESDDNIYVQDFFLMKNDVCKSSINELSNRYPAFSNAYKKAKEKQEMKLLKLGGKGKLNPVFTMFNLKCNHGYQDTQVIKQETTHIDGNTDLNTLSDTELEDRIRRLAGQIDS